VELPSQTDADPCSDRIDRNSDSYQPWLHRQKIKNLQKPEMVTMSKIPVRTAKVVTRKTQNSENVHIAYVQRSDHERNKGDVGKRNTLVKVNPK
jgi:hypothetical protein